MIIQDLHDLDVVVATRSVDLTSWLYHFNRFVSLAHVGSSFVAHAYSMSEIWKENFGHVNYKY